MAKLLPTGTVTFLFTDIEGSTRLLQELGDAYADELAKHRRALREAFAKHGGVEVDTQGDAFFVAFARATDALAAADQGQKTLAEGPIRVRMGLHTGQPIVTEDGYLGADVHRAARIAAAGHGGQVLVSASTAALVDRGGLRDLGDHRLKDLADPERLYQLGDGDFPPVKSLYRTNLPVPLTSFIGRKRELADVVELLNRDGLRLLTLTGPGGAGKTRLAAEAAAEVADEFPDGVWWVPLAPLRDPNLVLSSVARALEVREQPGQELAATLATKLAGTRMLVVLDNVEHLLPTVAEAINALRVVAGPILLVTSRERLQLGGEHVWAVPPLLQSDAEELFLARSLALDPGFTPSEAVPELCARLDQLPLALELAAARTVVFSPGQLVERLSQRLDLLRGGRDADPRQQTLRATIAWSYDLLEPGEQRLFRQLAVFAGGCTHEAAEEVCGADPETLQSLIDKSLLRRRDLEPGPRFWMLDTIGEFAGERLEGSGETEEMRRRHAVYFGALADETQHDASGPRGVPRIGVLRAELDNFHAALAWLRRSGEAELELKLAISLFELWVVDGSAGEGRRAVQGALTGSAQYPLHLRAEALKVAGDLALDQGEYAIANELLEQALGVYRELALDRNIAKCLTDLGHVAKCERNDARAEALFEQSIELARGLDGTPVLADALLNFGDFLVSTGDFARAEVICRESLALWEEHGDRLSVGACLFSLGLACLQQNRHEEARDSLKESLSVFGEFEYAVGIGYSFEGLAALAAVCSRGQEAARLLGAAEVLFESAGASLEPAERALHERTTDALRADLGEAGLEHFLADGRTMSLKDSVEYALHEIE